MARTDGSPVFIDTNVLIYAALARSPLNLEAKGWLQKLSEQATALWISRQVIREFLAVMTRSRELVEEVPLEALMCQRCLHNTTDFARYSSLITLLPLK